MTAHCSKSIHAQAHPDRFCHAAVLHLRLFVRPALFWPSDTSQMFSSITGGQHHQLDLWRGLLANLHKLSVLAVQQDLAGPLDDGRLPLQNAWKAAVATWIIPAFNSVV